MTTSYLRRKVLDCAAWFLFGRDALRTVRALGLGKD
jgi:hypothetical protein